MRLKPINWLQHKSFPPVVSIAIILTSGTLWFHLNQLRLKQNQQDLEKIAISIGRELEEQTTAITSSLVSLAQTPPESWGKQMPIITKQFPALQAIATGNKAQELIYLLPCDCQTSVTPIIQDMYPEVSAIKVTSTFAGVKGNRAFLIYVPNESKYLIALIDLEHLLKASKANFPKQHIHLLEQDKLIYHTDLFHQIEPQSILKQQIVPLHFLHWDLVLLSTPNQDQITQLILVKSLLIGGLIVGSLFGSGIYLWQKQKQAQDQVRQESDRLFMEVQDLCCIANFNGYFQQINPAWSKTLGYTESELLSHPYSHFIHPEDQELTRREMQKLIDGEKTVMLENRYRDQDGSYHLFAWRATVSLESALIYAVARDITEERQARLVLDQHQKLLNEIVTNLLVIVYATDAKGIVTFSDGQSLEHLQLQPKELLGQSILTLYQDYPDILNSICQVLDGNECTWQATLNNRFYLSKASPLKNNQGEVIGLTGITQDLTEQQQLQDELEAKEIFLRKIINTISDAILVVDSFGHIVFFNPMAQYMLGSDENQLQNYQLGLPLVNGKSTDIYLLRPDRTLIVAEMHVETMQWQNQEAYLISLRDITERKQAEEKLQKNEERLENILNSLEDIVWSQEPVTRDLTYINPAVSRIFGYSLEEIYQIPEFWFAIMHPEDIEFVRYQINLLETKKNKIVEFEYRLRDTHGVYHWLYSRAWSVLNSNGEIVSIDGIETDITVKKQTEMDLEHRKFYDELTNLPNRAFFISHLEYLCSNVQQNQDYRFALLILDIDEFKVVNDGLGHSLGDKLLQQTALALKSCLDPTDFIARLGGDEFGILLEDHCDLDDAIALVKTIQAALNQSFNIEDHYQINVKTSIGIAFSDPSSLSPETLLRNADTALYRAKDMGKNNYVIFNPEMHSKALHRLEREVDLRHALENNHFILHYQPILSLLSGKLVGFEALVRLQHPVKGLLFPGDFITIAEETGLIAPIGLWVFRTACEQLKEWQIRYPQYSRVKLSVNLSARQFHDPNLILAIDTVLQEVEIDPQSIKLEITESLFMEDTEKAIILLQKLKERNLKICVDDFGTGYSSLSYLHKFPLNTLKIDRCFVNNVETSVESVQIIKIIVNLAHSLGLDTIAEGIENQAQLEFLKSIGCDQGQGYLFSKPLSVEAVEVYLSKKDETITELPLE